MPFAFSEDTIIDQTLANETVNSEAVDIRSQYGFSVYVSCTGTSISGTFFIQASVDGENWINLTGNPSTLTDNFEELITTADAFYKYMRVSIESDNANTVTALVKFNGKGV